MRLAKNKRVQTHRSSQLAARSKRLVKLSTSSAEESIPMRARMRGSDGLSSSLPGNNSSRFSPSSLPSSRIAWQVADSLHRAHFLSTGSLFSSPELTTSSPSVKENEERDDSFSRNALFRSRRSSSDPSSDPPD
jgi:hypothetical protein